MKKDKEFYVGQKAVIEKNGKVLVLNDPILGFDLPGGKIQEGEEHDLVGAFRREIKEETNLEVEIIGPFFTGYFKIPKGYHRNSGKEVFIVYYRCKYSKGILRLSNEHNGYQWVTKKNFMEIENDTTSFKALKKYFM